jgi:hypothetical protein
MTYREHDQLRSWRERPWQTALGAGAFTACCLAWFTYGGALLSALLGIEP